MTKPSHCSFCRAPREECAILIQGPEAAICGSCVVTCVNGVMNPPRPPAEKGGTLGRGQIVTPPLVVVP